MKIIRSISLFLIFLCITTFGYSQIRDLGLKKAKGKLKGLIEDASGKEEKKDESDNNQGSGNKTLSKRMSQEEVIETLDAARSSFNSKSYSDARFSIQQALVEIEIQLGEKVLEEMPKTAMGQNYDPDDDRAISTGVGFIGLDITRQYPSDNGDIVASIANNAAIFGPYNMALSNPQMISQNENMKAVTVDGKRGVLELNGDSFRLALPFGQSSLFMLDCESCPDEASILNLAGEFDLDAYLKILGEAPIATSK